MEFDCRKPHFGGRDPHLGRFHAEERIDNVLDLTVSDDNLLSQTRNVPSPVGGFTATAVQRMKTSGGQVDLWTIQCLNDRSIDFLFIRAA